jgi:hypothetical protein
MIAETILEKVIPVMENRFGPFDKKKIKNDLKFYKLQKETKF